MTGGWAVLAELQLVLAGFALLLAAQQASVWRWEGLRSSSRLMVGSSLATAAVFISNETVLRALTSPQWLDGLLFIRSAALGLLAVSTLALAASVADRPVPRWLTAGIVVVVGARLALWPATDLVYAHRLDHGWPVYGPLMAPTGLAVIVLVFGYLCVSASRGRSDQERTVLVVGLVASLVLAVITVVSGSAVAAEVLSGYLPFPALVAIATILWSRELNAHRTVRQLADRQRMLAELGRFALTAELPAVVAAGHDLVAGLGSSADDVRRQDCQFVNAVGAVVAAAEGQSRANEELRHHATVDELTGLANRSVLREIVDHALTGTDSETSTLAVALCNIDRFRAINDVHGHSVGDEVLREMTRRLLLGAHSCDTVGRFGGDEFAIVCTDAGSTHSIESFGDGLIGAFGQPSPTAHVGVPVTASIGVVSTTTDEAAAVNADTLFRDAGTAMYDAKLRGGAGVGRFHDGLRSAVVDRADLERHLHGAVDRGDIVVHYQPILSLSDRRIVGFEALARLRQGSVLVAPAQWVPIAESTSLINEIGENVLLQAVEQLRMWLAAGHETSISVNVSPRQLSSSRFPDLVHRCLASGIPPALISLEVTESLPIDEHASGVLDGLRRAGVRIALDDFGTGYSALAAVSRLPIDTLKVDRSIVSRAGDPQGRALLASVLGIAHSLDLSTVAEGVETPELQEVLDELHCGFVQGYLYSRPVDAVTASRLLLDSPPVAASR